ncbi:MAG: hypothetical protein Q4P20_06335 [Eubacteriales bacterium]|nr:hypothetical protein [Eubacteriales bacterium]
MTLKPVLAQLCDWAKPIKTG